MLYERAMRVLQDEKAVAGMPIVIRSDSQRSDTTLRPRVSFNRDVHVKRIGTNTQTTTTLVNSLTNRLTRFTHPQFTHTFFIIILFAT